MGKKIFISSKDTKDIHDNNHELYLQSVKTWKNNDLPKIVKLMWKKYKRNKFYVLTKHKKIPTTKGTFHQLNAGYAPVMDGNYYMIKMVHIPLPTRPPLIPGGIMRYIDASGPKVKDSVIYVLPEIRDMEKYLDKKSPCYNPTQERWIQDFFKQSKDFTSSKRKNKLHVMDL